MLIVKLESPIANLEVRRRDPREPCCPWGLTFQIGDGRSESGDYPNVATIGAWSLVPNSRETGQAMARLPSGWLARM